MQIGWCGPLIKAAQVKDIGYDYIELPLNGFDLDSDAGLREAMHAVSEVPLPSPVFNSFFPKNIRIVGNDIDARRIKTYIARCAALTHHAGATVAVLGSGWTRIVPEGFSRDRAEQQLLDCFHWCAEEFQGSGVTVAIEAQNRKETNIITTLAEAMRYAKAINRPEVRIMADFYHMDEEQEPLSDLRTYADWIVHVQLADTGRLNPGSGSYDYGSFFRHLGEGGYSGRASVECLVEISGPQMRRSLEFLRSSRLSG